MWIFTRKGFFSVVEYDPKKDPDKKSFARSIVKRRGSHVLVRARVKEDLDDLKRVVKKLKVEDEPTADYRFRAVIPRKKWIEYLTLCAQEIDYDSHFKEVVRANATQPAARYQAMMNVWSDMAVLQPTKPYGNVTGLLGGKSDDFSYYGGYGKYDYPAKTHTAVTIDKRAVQARLLWQAPQEVPEDIVSRMTDDAFELYCQADDLSPDKPLSRLQMDNVLSQMALDEADGLLEVEDFQAALANSERTQK